MSSWPRAMQNDMKSPEHLCYRHCLAPTLLLEAVLLFLWSSLTCIFKCQWSHRITEYANQSMTSSGDFSQRFQHSLASFFKRVGSAEWVLHRAAVALWQSEEQMVLPKCEGWKGKGGGGVILLLKSNWCVPVCIILMEKWWQISVTFRRSISTNGAETFSLLLSFLSDVFLGL